MTSAEVKGMSLKWINKSTDLLNDLNEDIRFVEEHGKLSDEDTQDLYATIIELQDKIQCFVECDMGTLQYFLDRS